MTFDDDAIARPVLWPDSAAQGATEKEALERVGALIRELSSRTQLVRVEVEVPEQQANTPWLAKAGVFANDPTWDDFLKEMADYRRQLDDERAHGQDRLAAQ
jgi:hypothetical protein